MNILVTGGLGFIGMNLCNKLFQEGHKVSIMDKKNPEVNLDDRFEIFNVDFTDEIDYEEILRDIDLVYHLISTTVPGTSNEDKVFDITSNVCGTLRLLDAMVEYGIKKVIFLSSGGTVYGDVGASTIKETVPTNPISSYGIHKLTIEKYLNFYYHEYGLDYTIVRLSNPYGSGQQGKNAQGIIPIFIDRMMQRNSIEIWGDGGIIRDYIYIGDVVDALGKLVYYKNEQKILNLGSGVGYSILQIIELMAETMGLTPNIIFLPSRKIDVKCNILDINTISRELNWRPKVSLQQGMQKMINLKGARKNE